MLLAATVPVITLPFRVIVADDSLAFYYVDKRVLEAVWLVVRCGNLPYFDLLDGTVNALLLDVVNKPPFHIGSIIPQIEKTAQAKENLSAQSLVLDQLALGGSNLFLD